MIVRKTPLLFGLAALAVSGLVGCHNEEPAHHHTRTTDTRYDDTSRTAGERIDRDTTYNRTDDAGVVPAEPGTAGTRAPTQSARPDPLIDAPRDPSGH